MQKRTINRLLNFTLNALAWLTFVFSVMVVIVTMVAFVNDPAEGKSVFGVKFFSVQSGSMSLPDGATDEKVFFDAGDVILVRDLPDGYELCKGDVITFVSESAQSFGLSVTHKIREVRRNSIGEVLGYVTYGIHTGVTDDGLVRPENVQGIYAGKLPSLGWLVDFLKKPSGYYLCILLPFMLIIIHLSVRVGMLLGRGKAYEPRHLPRVPQNGNNALTVKARKKPRIILHRRED